MTKLPTAYPISVFHPSCRTLTVPALACLTLITGCSLRPRDTSPQPMRGASCATTPSVVAPASDLESMTLQYQGTFGVPGREMPLTSTLVATPHPAGGWSVSEHAQLPRGVATDSARIESRSLVPRERIISQGAMRTALSFTDDEATGTITMAGEARPITVELCGPLTGDGAGAFLVIARLPLTDGYRATLRHLDLQKPGVTTRQLAVVGSETITVPAGTYDVWKVQLRDTGSPTPTTIWVGKAARLPVKFVSTQGPVTVTMELVRAISSR